MNVLHSLGLAPKKIRYAIVALGDISQEAMLPGVAATGNSEVVAFVTDDAAKASGVGERYGVSATYRYDQFAELLASGTIDAIYLATPNFRHAEFVIPALEAGIHVLVEKPLEISTELSRRIVAAANASTAKLMVAYRLHFEPATLALIERVRSGDLGRVHLFASTFAQVVDPANHRVTGDETVGPVFDMGPYPINAARMFFEDEPESVVSATGTRHTDSGFTGDYDDTVAVVLRFPGDRLAQFTVSYYGNATDEYTLVGTKGGARMSPAYMYGEALELETTIGERSENETFKNTDHFGGELKYFSDCILKNEAPEPDAEEGYADVRVIEGVMRALHTGKPQTLEPFSRRRRIDPQTQLQTLPAKKTPELVNASSPAAGKTKGEKN